jgi:hypothetical protein
MTMHCRNNLKVDQNVRNEVKDLWRETTSQFHQHFTRKFFVQISPQSQNQTREKLQKRHSYEKFVRKMVMKLAVYLPYFTISL